MTTELLAKATERWSNRETKLEVNDIGDLFCAKGLPFYAETTRRGERWAVIATSAVACLVVRPSTVAAITVWNGESSGGKAYIIDQVFTHNLVSDNVEGRYLLWACVHPQGMTKPTADLPASATQLRGANGKHYNGLAVVDVGATVVDNGWYPVSTSHTEVGAALPGGGIVVNIEGRLIVPPQGGISIQVVGSHTDATFCSGLSWYESKIDLQL